MLSTHVPFQMTRFTKTLLAHITFVRFLVRVNTHVGFQITRMYENASRTHHIHTVSRSCEYACGLSKYQNHENASRTHHIRTVSRSCEYACGFQITDDENASRTHHIVRFLVRVNTQCFQIQITKSSRTHTFYGFLRVNTQCFQITRKSFSQLTSTASRSCEYARVWPI